MTREFTKTLIQLMDENVLEEKEVLYEFLHYLSEQQIKEFCLDGFGGQNAEYIKMMVKKNE